MFMQVIQAKVKNEQGIHDAVDQWQRELKPGAKGYLGTTSGACDDGTFIALVRFESKADAMRNSERPEQGQWWDGMASNFDGEATFMESDDAQLWMDGGSDDAGFVQVMMGRSPDVKRLRDGGNEATDRLRAERPEIIGGTFAIVGDDGYIQTVYFRTEAAARQMETTEPPDDVRAMIEERMRLMGEVTYYDLHQPKMYSA